MKKPRSVRGATTVVLCALALAALVGQGVAEASSTPFSRIIVFGDSTSDTGNFYRICSAWWGPENAYPPSPPYWEGHWSNGRMWVEYLAEDLGMSGLLDNYAVGGAASGHENAFVAEFGGVQDQIEQYLQASPQADPDALYILWAGHNDIFLIPPGTDINAALTAFVDNTVDNITTLWQAGARHILVPNISDIGKCPGVIALGLSGPTSEGAASFNRALAIALKELAAEGKPTLTMDAFGFFDHVTKHPAQYGFSDVTGQGISVYPAAPTGYLFWDDSHPTTQFHRAIGQFALTSYYSPSRGKGMPPAQVNALNRLLRTGKGPQSSP